ncbi:MAG: hypothetical protein K0S21_565 [Rhizobiaceae bacterium]|nr:hypothetical protein [Rhizobiaceae bacterium]
MDRTRDGSGLKARIELIDLARGAALAAMAVYHFTWDLEFFSYVQAGTTAAGGWKFFARSIASSFLFLVGVSLFLAHGHGVRWPGFWRRLAMIGGAAAAISLATWIAVPKAFIFFGILHQIALASLIGLLFLRLPWMLNLAAAVAVIAAPHFLRSAFFDHPAWWWLGLSTANPRSNDYVPVFPWFGAVLAGIAAAGLARRSGLLPRLAALPAPSSARPLMLAGRHSLAFYLVHQPLLIAGIWLFSQAIPASPESPEEAVGRSCQASCTPVRDIAFCTRYCGCVLDALRREDLLDEVVAGSGDVSLGDRIEEVTGMCMAEAEGAIDEGGRE